MGSRSIKPLCRVTGLNIFISGGGTAEQSAALDRLYFGGLKEGSKITYIPVAIRGKRSFAACALWFEDLLSRYGKFDVAIVDDLNTKEIQWQDSEALYIGGGNTYSLLREIDVSGCRESVVKFAVTGKPVYGGSAGAVVLGRDIGIIETMDRDRFNTIDTTGLNLIKGYSIYPHYDESADPVILQYIAKTSIPVLALPENAGVWISSAVTPVGRVVMFDSNGKRVCL